MSTALLITTLENLYNQLEAYENFSDWIGCARIEQEISEIQAILEERNVTI